MIINSPIFLNMFLKKKKMIKKFKKELESYIDRYATVKKGPAPRRPQFYYFI
ncbi:unnamed protein product [Paramecium octaurelia]|uniref:Uncharacterized protein n=1 Tax=Paramecium octaurelia TaxID=43137 RepID=A0A8S1VJB1_PAROT|nr:unnamed protein product [Paramecium octaurelia]